MNSGNGGYSENFRSWDLDADNDCGEEFEIGLEVCGVGVFEVR